MNLNKSKLFDIVDYRYLVSIFNKIASRSFSEAGLLQCTWVSIQWSAHTATYHVFGPPSSLLYALELEPVLGKLEQSWNIYFELDKEE